MINYDLGRTEANIDWAKDVKSSGKAEGVKLSQAAKDQFQVGIRKGRGRERAQQCV